MSESRVNLPGSFRPRAPGAQPLGPIDPDELVAVTMVLRRRAELTESALAGDPISVPELAERYGAAPADVEVVRQTVEAAGARVTAVDAASRRMRVEGPASALAALFGTALQRARSNHPVGVGTIEHRYREGSLTIPAALASVVVAVLGLDTRPQARANLRAARTVTTSYTPVELATVYQLPRDTDGAGQTLAIIELGGGYGQGDLAHYFAGIGTPVPSVKAVGVDGASNSPGRDRTGADGEVLLDIEVAGAIAPKAAIVVYFAPNTDAGFLDAVATAAHATPTPTAISISWGQAEDQWTEQARTAMDQAFADACALGVTVTVAAGDNGSADSETDGAAHVDFPASSPHVLACGGTTLHANPTSGAVSSETVWNDGSSGGATGGGVSAAFPLPEWQQAVGVPARAGAAATGRGVPDVAADADPQTGYQVYVDGQPVVYGGTSAVAPLWAALVCRLAQSLGRKLGLLQPALYAGAVKGEPAPGFRDIKVGDNGAYQARQGWDACTGLGVPDGTALLALLQRSD